MSYKENFNIIYHFNLLDDIVLFGKTGNMHFLCIIKKFLNKVENPNYPQDESSVFIKDKDGIYYNVQVILLPEKLMTSSQSLNKELFMSVIKFYANEIYKNLKKDSSKIKTIDYKKSKGFPYFLYDIPAYIWCIAVGMITTKL